MQPPDALRNDEPDAGRSRGTAAAWDPTAAAWGRHAQRVDRQSREATELMLRLAGVASGGQVLDLASGPGGAGMAAAAIVGEHGRVVLSDGSAPMVAVAAQRTRDLPQVEAMVLDLVALDVPDASFDAVLCRHGLMFVAEPVVAAREAARVLRPGGRLAVGVWDARERNPWLGIVLDAVSAQFGGVPVPPPGVPGPFSLGDADHLAGVLTDAGFREIEVHRVSAPMHAASVAEWWEVVPQLAGPLAGALAGLDEPVREELAARAIGAAEAAAARDGEGGIALPGSVLVAAGRV